MQAEMTAQLIVGQPIKSTRLPRFYEPSIHRTLALSKVSATCSSRAGPAPAELCVRAHVARLQTCAARRKHAQQRSNERPEPCLAWTSTVRTAPIACRRTTHDKTAPAAHRTMVSGCLYKPGDHRRFCALRPSRKRGSIHRPSAPPRVEPRLPSPCHHFASCASATGRRLVLASHAPE